MRDYFDLKRKTRKERDGGFRFLPLSHSLSFSLFRKDQTLPGCFREKISYFLPPLFLSHFSMRNPNVTYPVYSLRTPPPPFLPLCSSLYPSPPPLTVLFPPMGRNNKVTLSKKIQEEEEARGREGIRCRRERKNQHTRIRLLVLDTG